MHARKKTVSEAKVELTEAQAVDLVQYLSGTTRKQHIGCVPDCGPAALFAALESRGYEITQD